MGKKRRKVGRPRERHRNEVIFGFRLSVALYTAFAIAARLRQKPMADLLRDLVRDFVEEFSLSDSKIAITKILEATELIKQLIAYARIVKTSFLEQKGGNQPSREERQKKRVRLLNMGMDAFDQVYVIAQSERKAEASKYRIQAYQVLASLGKLNAALIRDATDEELLSLMLELDDENERLKAMAVEIQTRATQETTAAEQPPSVPSKPQ